MTRPPDDDALIWNDRRRTRTPAPSRPPGVPEPDAASRAPDPPPGADAPPPPSRQHAAAVPEAAGRLPLRVAAGRYGVSASTLGAWCRSGQVDGILATGPSGRRWMVTPGSVAERVSAGRGGAPGRKPPTAAAEAGAMLVPRAAWDKLMDQLGNLHEAGQQLAEARERAARYETEVVFLRERLAEVRAERDEARRGESEPVSSPRRGDSRQAGSAMSLLRSWRRRLGRDRLDG